MKHHKYIVMTALAASTILLCSRSGGLAEIANQDRTGSPLSSGLCSSCHNSGPWTTTSVLSVIDPSSGLSVTSYVPGATYTVEMAVSATGGTSSPSGWGFQATAMLDDNSDAGTFSAPASNTQIDDVSGRHMIEHNALSGTNTFSVSWTAPAAGSGTATFYGVGMAANGNGGSSGDDAGVPIALSLSEESVSVEGCTYAAAQNYNPAADVDDGSCQFNLPQTYCGEGTTFNTTSGQCEVDPGCTGDLNGDGNVGTPDVLVVLGAFGTSCD